MSSGRTGTRVSSRPVAAVTSALRAATGRELTRVPVRPDDIVGLS